MYTCDGWNNRTTSNGGWAICTGHARCNTLRLMLLVWWQISLADVTCLKHIGLRWCFMSLANVDVTLSMRTPHVWCVQVLVDNNDCWPTLLDWSSHPLADATWRWSLQILSNRWINAIRSVCKSLLRCLPLADIYKPMCAGYGRCWQDTFANGRPMSACYERFWEATSYIVLLLLSNRGW